jgi:hypothetical protein
MNPWADKDIFKKSLISHCVQMLSICISSIKQEKSLKMKIWIVVTSFICFTVSWFNRGELDHNQLDVMIQYILGVYKKIGKILAGMIDLFIDVRRIAEYNNEEAEREAKIIHQKILAKVTLLECYVFFGINTKKNPIIETLIGIITNSIPKLIDQAETDTDFGQIVRICKKIGLIYIEMKISGALYFLYQALDLAQKQNLTNQFIQIRKIIGDYIKQNNEYVKVLFVYKHDAPMYMLTIKGNSLTTGPYAIFLKKKGIVLPLTLIPKSS